VSIYDHPDTYELAARVEKVLAMHREQDGECKHCSSFDYEGLSGCAWPCPTVRALNGEEA
jgi:hypothetical protein